MEITLSRSETEWSSINQNQAIGETNLEDTLPISKPRRSHQSSDAQFQSRVKARKPFWETWIQYINQLLPRQRQANPTRTGKSYRRHANGNVPLRRQMLDNHQRHEDANCGSC